MKTWATAILVVGFLIFLLLFPAHSEDDPYACYGSSRYQAEYEAWPACDCDAVKLINKSCFAALTAYRFYGSVEDTERLARACGMSESHISEGRKCLAD